MHLALFCRVIDNYGDAGVAWRLARRLGVLGHTVELWIDDTATLSKLAPGLAIHPRVQVRHWTDAIPDTHPDAAICLFGAVLPDALLATWTIPPPDRPKAGIAPPRVAATAGSVGAPSPPPVWINLEYLTCEDWALGCHGLPSPHPRLPLTQWFYFPGMRAGLGCVVCEPQTPFDAAAFRAQIGLPPADAALRISLFSYANAALPALLQTWNDGPQPIELLLCPGPAAEQVAAMALPAGNLRIHPLPWLLPDDYDRLLRHCDLNFVRGEDSFVRAQLAARPLVWQAYVQNEAAHQAKVAAFIDQYAPAPALAALNLAWNAPTSAQTPVDAAWHAFAAQLPSLQTHAENWRMQTRSQGDLAENLMKFIGKRL